ncbi:hypothetical protein [Amycolatopsis sp. NPDC051071]|uniref:hypothetical protein n=1 Tax=Amycolatopsis sp. NPDC051071 TaxID=3154637 RepID=UPI0034496C72
MGTEPSPEELYLTVRTPAFRDPHGGEPAPLDPHGELIRTAFFSGDTAAAWKFRPELDLLQPWLVFDDEKGETHVVTAELLEKLGTTREAAIERARATTAASLGRGGESLVSIGDGGPAKSFAVRATRHARGASLLTVPGVLEPWRARVPGELLVLPACDNDIMIVGSEAEYLAAAVTSAIGQHQRFGDRRLSSAPYTVADGGLLPWRPPESSPAYAVIREAEVAQQVAAYTAFAGGLRQHLHGVDADVGAARRGESETTALPFSYSFTTLVGPAQYLPFAEYIGFENLEPQQDDFAWVPFERLRDLPGATMTPAWEYGLPVVRFEPPADLGTRRELSVAIREVIEDPWA